MQKMPNMTIYLSKLIKNVHTLLKKFYEIVKHCFLLLGNKTVTQI